MPTARCRYARGGHGRVANRLEPLQSMVGNDLIEGGEILVEKPNERVGLGAFSQ